MGESKYCNYCKGHVSHWEWISDIQRELCAQCVDDYYKNPYEWERTHPVRNSVGFPTGLADKLRVNL